MRAARFHVSVELLREALHMPMFATIVQASMSTDGVDPRAEVSR